MHMVLTALAALTLGTVLISAKAGAAGCASYLQAQKKLNAQAQGLIGKALDDHLDTTDPRCGFSSDQWSIRDEKHQAWCAGKGAAAIGQRLNAMEAELSACGGGLDRQRRTAAAVPRKIDAADSTPDSAAPPAIVAEQILDFDRLQAGALPADAFRNAGVRIAQAKGVPGIYASLPSMVLPAGRKQVLLVAGDRTTSLTLAFDAPISRFGLTRIGTAGGASTPTWKLEAFNNAGNSLGVVGEEQGLPAAPQQFSITGDGIVRVVISTDNRYGEGTWATWNSLPIAEMTFKP